MTEIDLLRTKFHVTVCCNYLEPSTVLAGLMSLMKDWGPTHYRVYTTNRRHQMLSLDNASCQLIENDWNDFTGYMHSCRVTAESTEKDEGAIVYLFLNDTLLVRHPRKFLMKRLKKAVPTIVHSAVPILVGRADSYDTLLQTSPFAPGLDRYISTFLFATNRLGITLLEQLFFSQETIAMLQAAAWRQPGNLPAAFEAFLQLHLGSHGSRFSWQGRRDSKMLEKKAGGVLLEHLISARFFTKGFIYPLNYNVPLDLMLWALYRLRFQAR